MSSRTDEDARLIEDLEKLTFQDRPCLIWKTGAELVSTVVPFIRTGASRGDRCLMVGRQRDERAVRRAMNSLGMDVRELTGSGVLAFVQTEGAAETGWLMRCLKEEAAHAHEQGRSLRVVIDISLPAGQHDGKGLHAAWKKRLDRFLAEKGCLALCHLRRLGASQEYLEGVMYSHRVIIAGGRVRKNIFASLTGGASGGKRTEARADALLDSIIAFDHACREVKRSEEWTHFLLEKSNEAIFILQDSKLVLANRKAIEFTGYSYDDLLSMSIIFNIVHPDDMQMVLDNYMRRIDGDTSISRYAFRIYTKERNLRWAELSGGLIEWKGRPAALYLISDITEKRAAEERLKSSEERYRKLVETLPDPVVMYDLEGNFIAANQRTAEIYGTSSAEEFLSEVRNISEVLDGEGRAKAAENQKKGLEQGQTPLSEYTLFRRDRSTVDVEISSTAVGGSDGKPEAFISIVRDITERKLAENLLAIQHEMARAMSTAGDLKTGLKRALDIVLQINGLDCGGVYVMHDHSGTHEPGTIELLVHTGIPPEFAESVSFYTPDDPRAMIIAQGAPVYTTHREVASFIEDVNPVVLAFAVRGLAIVPVRFEGRVVGAIMVGSHTVDDTPLMARKALEGIAAQIGGAIARARVVEALRRSEENYRELMEYANNIILRVTPEGIITYINEFGQRFFGYAEEEIQGREVIGTILPDYDSTGRDLRTMAGEIFRNPERYQNNVNENIRKNGERVWVSWTNRAIRDESGAILDILSIGTDVTERKKAEEALRKSEERFRGYFNLPLMGVAVVSPEGNWIEVNGKICSILGYSPEELRSMSWMELTPSEDVEEEKIRYQNFVMGSRTDATFEKRYVRKDGGVIFVEISVHCVRLLDGSPDYVVAIFQDVTGRKKSEEMLIQALKMESVGRLAGGVAHDLNNLLTPILGYSDILMSDLHQDDPRYRSIAQISKAAESAKRLTHQLLAFSRRQVLEMKLVDFNKILSGFEKILRRTIREDIEIRIDHGRDIGGVNADIGQVEQILMNLAVNAQDAMPAGGVLTIRTGVAVLDEAEVIAGPGLKAGPYVLLEVSDTGMGMDAVTLEHIFEPFFTTKERGMGTGLGLSTIYGIVNQHGGFVNVSSEPGKGTCFRIYLPRQGDFCIEEEQLVKSPQHQSNGRETILIAEDNYMVKNLASEILGRLGYHVITADNARECIEAAAAHQGRIDLLLTDVIMPDMNGKDLFMQLSAGFPHLRVVYMSGYAEDVIAHHGVLDKGVDFIQKPFSAGNLVEKIREVLDRP